MGDPAVPREQGGRPPVEIDCEDCGERFTVDRPRARRVVCPYCGNRTLVPVQRAPQWFLAVAGVSVAAVAIPGLAYRLAGPATALPIALLTLGAVWWFGRRL